MKKNILRLLAWTVFAIGAVMPSYAADYADDIVRRLSHMSTEEKIELLIVDEDSETAESDAAIAARYPGADDADDIIASISAGDTYLYFAAEMGGYRKP